MKRKGASGKLSRWCVAGIEDDGIFYPCMSSQYYQICLFADICCSFVDETFFLIFAITEIGVIEVMIDRFVEHEIDVEA